MVGHRRSSVAGPEKGLGIPEEREVYTVDQPDSPEEEAEDGNHTVISWHGGEYSRQNTWIEAHENSTIDLEDAR